MSGGQDPDTPAGSESWPPGSLGLAQLKTEGEAILYDGEQPPPRTLWRRIRSALWRTTHRLRYLPGRMWWAIFGGSHYD